jgi:hypothetical protein
MKRYSIVGTRYGERGEQTICECDANPQPLAVINAQKRVFIGLHGTKRLFADKYPGGVRVIDHVEGRSWNVD